MLLVTDAQAHPPTVGLGHWLGTGTAVGELYPCACANIDDDPPEWLKDAVRRSGGDVRAILRCRPYIAKQGKRAGRWWSYCDCWGRRRDDGLPPNCCAWHEHNPAYAVGSVLSIAAPQPATVYAASGLPEPDDGLDEEDRILLDMDTGRTPYVRRWPPDEVTCTCPTPWDDVKDARKVGYHCVGCHTNWRNWAVSTAHQKHLGERCKDVRTAVNIDGKPIATARVVGTFLVWG